MRRDGARVNGNSRAYAHGDVTDGTNHPACGAAAAAVEALHTSGWYVGDSLLSAPLTRRLAERAVAIAGGMIRAQVRRPGAHTGGRSRGDDTQWITDEPTDASEREALAVIHGFRDQLNRSLYLGAHEVELHFARYPIGASYDLHRDAFRDDDTRLVSMVMYLNPVWPEDAGGELVIYDADGSGSLLTRVSPREGTMVCFWSERFPHEVLPAKQERFSLSGWLRRFRPP